MRLSTRAFLLWFVPFALVLLASFWALQTRTQTAVRLRLRDSLKETHARVAALNSRREAEASRFLRMVAESPSLKAGIQLVLVERSAEARATLEDQLRDICGSLGIEVMAVHGPEGNLLAAVGGPGLTSAALAEAREKIPRSGIWDGPGALYRMTNASVNQANDNLGSITVGQRLDLSEFLTPVAVTRNGKAVAASVPQLSVAAIGDSLRGCPPEGECEVELGSNTYLSLPLAAPGEGSAYAVRSLLNLDAAFTPVQAVLRNVFSAAALGSVIAGLLVGAAFSRSLSRPIQNLIGRLHASERTGLLEDLTPVRGDIRELAALTESFNRAASAVRHGQKQLVQAYIEFIASLSSALDARDGYTAGHSRRVSDYSVAVCEAMGLKAEETETIRIGALLHDIGKIGVVDTVLQKPARLTPEELTIIQKHPIIGRHILERIRGFERYLPIVELHHENWNGTGYPYRLRGMEVARGARIVHVVDAFDAMTTNRPYRQCMGKDRALKILRECAGSQFDPEIAILFVELVESGKVGADLPAAPPPPPVPATESVANLAGALERATAPSPPVAATEEPAQSRSETK